MLMVKALAGSGKTTNILWGLGVRVPKGIVCSPEQKAIAFHMRVYKWETCAAMAFNTSIAKVLEQRVPEGVQAATSNAFGHRAWLKHTGKGFIRPEAYKNQMIAKELMGTSLPWKERIAIENAVSRLVALCKCNLLDPSPEVLMRLADEFDIESSLAIFDYARQVYDVGVKNFELIDYDDQNFMPLYHEIDLPQYDLVVVDESQDLNRAKQEMAFRSARGSIVAVGDENQAIYGFSGADSNSMNNMYARMVDISNGEAITLPLTTTYRCPKAVVAEANKYVPDLRAHKSAPDGTVRRISEREAVKELMREEEGSMILCRTNAPLTSLAFRMIADNRRCFIQGKDIGKGLAREITKHGQQSLKIALKMAIDSIEKRIDKAQKATFPSDTKIEAYQDKINCLQLLCGTSDSISEFETKVDQLFKDYGSPNDHQLSTVHKAKGLEKRKVVIYKPSKLPMIFKSAKRSKKRGQSSMQIQQERNLAYVAYTRAMDTLTFAEEGSDKDISTDELVDMNDSGSDEQEGELE